MYFEKLCNQTNFVWQVTRLRLELSRTKFAKSEEGVIFLNGQLYKFTENLTVKTQVDV